MTIYGKKIIVRLYFKYEISLRSMLHLNRKNQNITIVTESLFTKVLTKGNLVCSFV